MDTKGWYYQRKPVQIVDVQLFYTSTNPTKISERF